MFASPSVVTILFMLTTVKSLHHTCKIAVNVQQLHANSSCSYLIPEQGDCALHMPEKSHEIYR